MLLFEPQNKIMTCQSLNNVTFNFANFSVYPKNSD